MRYLISVLLLIFSSTVLANNQALYEALNQIEQAQSKLNQAQTNIDNARNVIMEQIYNSDSGAWTCHYNEANGNNYKGSGDTKDKAKNNLLSNCLETGIPGWKCDVFKANSYCVEN